MRNKCLIAILGLIFWIGCQDNSQSPPEIEVFSGELIIHDVLSASPDDTDVVIFTVEGGSYKLDHVTNESNLCSSGGKASGFGTNTLRLTPTFFITMGNCDTLRVPQGWFKAHFKGDSLILGPDTIVFNTPSQADSLLEYIIRLSK